VSAIESAWSLVLAFVVEFRKAVAATHRYEQLKRLAPESDDPAANTARRIFVEFYSDE
jgi:hypothetical protein